MTRYSIKKQSNGTGPALMIAMLMTMGLSVMYTGWDRPMSKREQLLIKTVKRETEVIPTPKRKPPVPYDHVIRAAIKDAPALYPLERDRARVEAYYNGKE